jgi:hypothetical protein
MTGGIPAVDEERCLSGAAYSWCIQRHVPGTLSVMRPALGCADHAELVHDIADGFLEVERGEMIAHGW